MFRRLAARIPNGAQALTRLHPAELMALLEQAWNLRRNDQNVQLGLPDHRSDLSGIPVPPPPIATAPSSTGAPSPAATAFAGVLNSMAGVASVVRIGTLWDHLIYAYMVENTRVYEIFRRVVHEFLHGEKLGAPTTVNSPAWLRATEELFFRDPPPFSITNVAGHLRSDLRASRRNAYQRMFGMELNHGADNNSPYPFVRADAANNEFVSTFEELLREVWVGFTNRTTTSGANPTDDAKIFELATKLRDMLVTRRLGGNLSREEFFFVATMSWFHLTVDNNNLDIIQDLRAQAANEEQRLFKIAQMVGLPAHGLSRSYFQIAQPMSDVLTLIETGALNNPAAVRAFYDPALGALSGVMNTLIMHWSLITGRDMKARKVVATA
jgi:hypothetical protein